MIPYNCHGNVLSISTEVNTIIMSLVNCKMQQVMASMCRFNWIQDVVYTLIRIVISCTA